MVLLITSSTRNRFLFMDIESVILNRRTIHNYNTDIVSDEIIHKALNCFLHAPNHKHTQPWKILIANQEQREKLIQLNLQLKSEQKTLNDIEIKALRTKMSNPSHLMIVLQKNVFDNDFQSKEDYAAVSGAILNMQLYLWSQKIGCKWSSGKVTFHPSTYELLNIDPKTYTIVGFNWAGYFDRTPPKPKKQNVEDLLI